MRNYNENPEFEKKNRREKRLIIAVFAVILSLIAVLLGAVAALIGKYTGSKKEVESREDIVVTATPTPFSERKKIPGISSVKQEDMDYYLEKRLADADRNAALEELLGTSYDGVWTMSESSTSCIVKKDGKWGMASETGEILVPLRYSRFSFMDNTGWVEFEDNGTFYVFDDRGNKMHQYSNKTEYRLESEEAYLYRTAKAYMSGMEITFTIPEIEGDDYYGVEYRSMETDRVLYSAVGGYSDVGMFTYPDETGRAVAIRSDGLNNTIYYITENGCESRTMELPEGVNARWFDFMGNYSWADMSFSRGWMKVYVSDAVPGFLIDEYKNYLAFLNVDTLELIPFPEEYQTYFTMYNLGREDAMAILENTEGGPDNKYAICKGSSVLTEELYYWVEFCEKCIVASGDESVDILDYEGNIRGSYWDCSGLFINGRMLVLDDDGLYFIDENFEKCSEYLLPGWGIDGCFAYGVTKDGKYYFLPEITMEELPEPLLARAYTVLPSPTPTEVPICMTSDSYELVKTEIEVYRYMENGYVIRRDGCYGLADLEGKVLVEPIYPKWVYHDKEWISFEDSGEVTHVFNYSGQELYSYVCNQGIMTTEQGQDFYRDVYYRQGMKIEWDYNEETFYYGVHYYNAETGELIFELTEEMWSREENPMPDFHVASLPDESGTAVVIAGPGYENTIYQVTKDGYTEKTKQEYYVERRIFEYSDHEEWNRTSLFNGWLLTAVFEERGDLLGYSRKLTEMLYNINTRECVPLPEEYQNWYASFYPYSSGIYYGISGESKYDYNNGETDYVYYAICKRSKRLTEEIYQWIRFDTKYIIAGNNSFSHILDYEGNVLAEYKDVAFPFVDGKTLVCDDTGAFYIDENLCKCSDYIMEDVDYCHPDFIRKDDEFYLIHRKGKKE